MAEIAAANVAAWPVVVRPSRWHRNERDHPGGDSSNGPRHQRSGPVSRAAGGAAGSFSTWVRGTRSPSRNPHCSKVGRGRGLRRRIAEADRLLYAEIADHRADPDLATRTDVLAMLIRAADEDGRSMTDVELRDQLMTLLAAGHDTTATALAWALERLTRNPAVLDKAVRAAQPAGGDPAGDEYLDAGGQGDACGSAGGARCGPGAEGARRSWPDTGCRAGVMVVPGILLVHADAEVPGARPVRSGLDGRRP